MAKDYGIVVTSGKFKKFRAWNRRRNYLMKEVRVALRVFIAKVIWDKRSKTKIDLTKIKTILLIRNEGTVGDVVVSTGLIKCLSEAGYTVDCLLTKKSSQVLKYNPYVRTVYSAEDATNAVFIKQFTHTVPNAVINSLRNNHYDLIIDPCLFDMPVHRLYFFRKIAARAVLGFNKWKIINYYSQSLPFLSVHDHVTKSLRMIADFMGIEAGKTLCYDLHTSDSCCEDVRNFLERLNKPQVIIINPFTGSPERNFSSEQLIRTTDAITSHFPEAAIVILDHRNEIGTDLPAGAVINPLQTLHHVMELVRQADLIISPDTGIVHIAATWQKPLIAIYKNVIVNNHLWAPGYENASQIIVDQRRVDLADDVPALILNEIMRREILTKIENRQVM